MRLSVTRYAGRTKPDNATIKAHEANDPWKGKDFASAEQLAEFLTGDENFVAAICPVLIGNHRAGEFVKEVPLVGVDFDNKGVPSERAVTLEVLMDNPWVRANASVLYETISHAEDNPRCRALFRLPVPLTGQEAGIVTRRLLAHFTALYGADVLDFVPKNAANQWFGAPGKRAEVLDKTLDIASLPELPQRAHTNGVAHPFEGESTPYAKGALRKETDRAAGATEGARNSLTFRAGAAVGNYAAGGELDLQEARRAVIAAGVAAGLEESEATAATDNGIKRGLANPKNTPRKELPQEPALAAEEDPGPDPLDADPDLTGHDLGWIGDYAKHAAATTSTPYSFNLLCGLVAVSMATANTLRFQGEWGTVKTNLYACLVADSTIYGKTTAVSRMESTLEEAFPSFYPATDWSPEGLIGALAEGPQLVVKNEIQRIFDAGQLQRYQGALKGALTDIHDCRPQRRTLANKATIEVRNPFLSLIGTTTPSEFHRATGPEDWASGLMPRFLFALPDCEPNFTGLGAATPQDIATRSALAVRLGKMKPAAVCDVQVEKKAQELAGKYRETLLKAVQGDPVALAIAGRYCAYGWKFAMLLMAAKGESSVTLATMEAALALVDYFRHQAVLLMEGRDDSQAVNTEKLARVYYFTLKNLPEGATARKIQQGLHLPASTIKDCCAELARQGKFLSRKDGRTITYLPLAKEQQQYWK